MAKRTDSFQYGVDNLYTVPDNNTLTKYNYLNGLIDQYQINRVKTITEKQDWEELQTAKERYSVVPKFTSAHKPFDNPKDMLIAVRENGYLAYIDDVPQFNPITSSAKVNLDSITDYMNNYYDIADQGFFIFRKQLTCIIDKTNGLKIKFPDLVNPLLFCDSYQYDSEKKQIIFSSPYYETTYVNAYTKDEFIALGDDGKEGYYFYITNSQYDLIPKGKYPGYPIYKRIMVDGVKNTFDTITINGATFTVSKELSKVNVIDYELAEEGKCYLYLESVGDECYLHVAFTPKFLSETEAYYALPVSFKVGDREYADTIKLTTSANTFNPLKPLITISSPDIYFEVATEYKLTFPALSYLNKDDVAKITTIEIHYNEKSQLTSVNYNGINSDGRHEFITDPTVIPTQQDIPTELMFKLTQVAKDAVGLNPLVLLHGYSTSAIYRVPDNYLRVEQTVQDQLTYTEGGTSVYRVTFKGTGTLTIKEVLLKRVSDDLGYFSANDFTMSKVSEENGLFTYDITLDKKIFSDPVTKTTTGIKFFFSFETIKKDDTKVTWPGEALSSTMTINYFIDRWEIRELSFNNKLIGQGVFTFKVFDKLIGSYTDKYSSDPRLTLSNGKMKFSSNTVSLSAVMDWDFRTSTWSSPVRVTDYGDITVQYTDVVSSSSPFIFKHDKPVHPLVIKQRQAKLYENITGRIYFDLTYNEPIKTLYVDGGILTTDKQFTLTGSRNGIATMSPVFAPDGKNIIGIGIDVTANKGTKSITIKMNITGVNDYDYSNWSVPLNTTVVISPQSDFGLYSLKLIDFGYNKNVTAILSLTQPELEDAQVVATIQNPTTGYSVGSPNFDPIGNSDFKSTNFFIGNESANQKNFVLVFDIYEYENAMKDNTLPNRLYHHVELPFEAK